MKKISRQKEIKKQLRLLIPLASFEDFLAIETIANAGHLRHLPPSIAAWQATTTHARHNYSDYDDLLDEGYDQEAARHFALTQINETLNEWGCTKQISEQE